MLRKCFTVVLLGALAATIFCGCATGRKGLVEPVTSVPPRIDPVEAVADNAARSYGIAPVTFRTGVQARACAGSS